MRRLVAVVLAVAVGAGAATAAVGGDDGRTVEVELRDARGLLEGGDVRIAGAPAGRVRDIALTSRGTARVRLALDDDAPGPRADASAVVRPVDLLGDTVLDLDPGTAARPLRGPIPTRRAASAPRLDEVLGVLDPDGRAGLQALLVAGGQALAGRGAALSRTLADLRPALDAADATLGELGAQNAALRDLVADADRAAGKVDARRGDLDRLLRGLDRTLAAVDARRPALRAGLQGLPATLGRVRGTATTLAGTARAARPVARDLAAQAAAVTTALDRLDPFLRALGPAARDLGGAVRPLRAVLTEGGRGLRGLAEGVGRLRAAVPDVDGLLRAVEPAAPKFSEGFFVNFADQGAEPGRQPMDPFTDTRRGYWRGAAVLSCEAFGLRVEPGCLLRAPGVGALDRSRGRGRRPAPSRPAPALQEQVRRATEPVRRTTQDAGRAVERLTQDAGRTASDGVGRLLDLLLGP